MIYFDWIMAWALFMQSILAQVAIVPVGIGLLYLLVALRGD
jgi:hypothetical protein